VRAIEQLVEVEHALAPDEERGQLGNYARKVGLVTNCNYSPRSTGCVSLRIAFEGFRRAAVLALKQLIEVRNILVANGVSNLGHTGLGFL
jgi:hypothetical protein